MLGHQKKGTRQMGVGDGDEDEEAESPRREEFDGNVFQGRIVIIRVVDNGGGWVERPI